MAVYKNSYDPGLTVSPYLLQVDKNSATEGIIIDDILVDGSKGSIHNEVSGSTIWLKIESAYRITVLSTAPNTSGLANSMHGHWALSLMLLKSGELFVTEHSAAPKNAANRLTLTGYQMGTFDVIYAKIDLPADSLDLYY